MWPGRFSFILDISSQNDENVMTPDTPMFRIENVGSSGISVVDTRIWLNADYAILAPTELRGEWC
jgi:hypothetical protein